MYKDSADHRESIIERFSEDFREKYITGLAEHGGHLYNKNVQSMAKDEVLDFVSYLYTMIDQISVATEILGDIEYNDVDMYVRVQQAHNLLKFGNIDAHKEEDR